MSSQTLAQKVYQGLVWNQMRHFLLYPISFLTSVVLARGLEPQQFGVYAGIAALIGVVMMATSLGFEALCPMVIPRMDPEANAGKTGSLIRELLKTRAALSLACMPLGFLASRYAWKVPALAGLSDPVLFTILCYLLFLNLNSLLASAYKGLSRFQTICQIEVVIQTLNLAVCWFVVLRWHNVFYVFSAMALTQLLALILYLYGLREYLAGPREPHGVENGKLCLNLYFTQYVHFALGRQKDLLVIGASAAGPVAVGFYSMATRLVEAFDSLLTMGFGEVTQPTFTEAYAKGNREGLRQLWSLFMRLEILLTFPCLVLLIAKAREIVVVCYGENYLAAVPILKLFGLLLLISSGIFGGGTSQKVLYATGRQNTALYIVLTAITVNCLLIVLLIERHGVLGVAFATGASYIIWRAMELAVTLKTAGLTYPLAFLLKILAVSLLSLCALWPFRGDDLAMLVLSSLSYVASYALLIYLVRPFSKEDGEKISRVSPRAARLLRFFIGPR